MSWWNHLLIILFFFIVRPAPTFAQVPQHLKERYELILNLRGNEKYDQMIAKCKELISEEPQFEKAYEKLVEASRRENMLIEIKEYLERLFVNEIYYGYPYWSLGKIYEFNENFDQAIEYYKKCINLSPQFSTAYTNLIDIYVKKKKIELDNLKQYLDKLIETNPQTAEAYFALAYFYHSKYKPKKCS